MTDKLKKRPRSRSHVRGQTTNRAHLEQLRMHKSIREMLQKQGFVRIGSQKCLTVAEALTAMGK
jgi:hypothetical protein